MGTGSFDIDSLGPPLWGYALSVGVFRYDGAGNFAYLPNVWCERIDTRQGPEPPIARFRYCQGDAQEASFGWPSRFDEIWPIGSQGPYVVQPDDRLVVLAPNPDGSAQYLFDGFAQIPQVDIDKSQERVTFAAVGVAVRCWDRPIRGSVWRSAAHPEITDGTADYPTDLPCRFNPSHQGVGARAGIAGNSTSNAYYTGGSGGYPVFLDPLVEEYDQAHGTNFVSPWWISDALLYLLNVESAYSSQWVQWPTYSTLEALLQTYYPPPGGGVLNAATAITADQIIRDYSAAGKPLPTVVQDLLGYAGFLMQWQLTADGNGLPQTYLSIYRKDSFAAAAPKLVFLDVVGAAVNPAADNVTQISLARDCNEIVNAYGLETRRRLYEVRVQLAPYTWAPASGDQLASNRSQFFASSFTPTTPASTRRKYRWYTADECGDGHYNGVTQSTNNNCCDFDVTFPYNDDGSPSWVFRYRPGGHTLIATDSAGRPLKATLEISFGLPNGDPFVMTSPGLSTWIPAPYGWHLLPDRLGIAIDCEDPEQWNVGRGGEDVRGITWQVAPPSGKAFTLALTTVIESDADLRVFSPKRIASPTVYARGRNGDGSDHFQSAVITPGSRYYAGNGTDDQVVRDDTALAQTHADQLRSAHEFPPLAGSMTIPYVTTYYQVGDRIAGIYGRNASLQANVATDQGEAPSYPTVVGVSWTFEPRQTTVLQLSDRRAEATNL